MDCYGLLLDEGLKERRKKKVPLQAKEDEQSGSKATAARESWYKHQEHFTSYAGVTGHVLKCHAPQKSLAHTL